jgi:flavin-dependent dehydrogenase
MRIIPRQCDVVIIGGGPAGSSAATFLAQAGLDVVLLERASFPRNQVGESLIPHFWKFTDQLGVTATIEQEGFLAKAGAITVWDGKIHQVKFSEFGYDRPGLHVERDIFDDLLLQHARENGASIFTEVVVREVNVANSERVIVNYTDKRQGDNQSSAIACQFIVDASGHSSFLAKQFKTRQSVSSDMNFLSLWGYFENSRFVGVDRQSHSLDELDGVKPVTFVSSYKDGWAWHIVLRQKTSVGLIVHTNKIRGMDRQQREEYFKQTCADLPHFNKLLASAHLIEDSVQFRPDYSYYSTRICGENYYAIGDAAAFVDPVFSHGVQNAFYNAATTSLAIIESIKNKKNRLRYSQLCENRMQQFYGFSRALALGDYGCNGVDKQLVKNMLKSLSTLELELILMISEMTNRSENFRQLARDAGILGQTEENFSGRGMGQIESLQL